MAYTRFGALAALTVLGCSRGAAPTAEEPGPTITPEVRPSPSPPPSTPASTPASTPTAVASTAPVPPPPPPSFLLTELAPTQGDLTPLLVTQFERAQKKNLRPVIEFYADWCEPCRAFQENLEEPRMKAALTGTFLVKLNLDDWHDKLKETGFKVRSIPAFFFIGPDGRPKGKMLDGDKWGKATPANMSASLTKWLSP